MTEQHVEERLKMSEKYAANDGAKIMTSFVKQMKNKYDCSIHEDRAKILFDLAVQHYAKDNGTRYAVQQIAKDNKMH